MTSKIASAGRGSVTLAVEEPGDYNVLMAMGRALCVLGLHSWTSRKTDDGKPYRACSRCGKDDAGLATVRGADNQAWPR